MAITRYNCLCHPLAQLEAAVELAGSVQSRIIDEWCEDADVLRERGVKENDLEWAQQEPHDWADSWCDLDDFGAESVLHILGRLGLRLELDGEGEEGDGLMHRNLDDNIVHMLLLKMARVFAAALGERVRAWTWDDTYMVLGHNNLIVVLDDEKVVERVDKILHSVLAHPGNFTGAGITAEPFVEKYDFELELEKPDA